MIVNRKVLIKAIRHLILGKVIQGVARFIVILLLIRLLPTEEYGMYMVIVGYAEASLLLHLLGFLPAIQKAIPLLCIGYTKKIVVNFILLVSCVFLILSLLILACFNIWQEEIFDVINFQDNNFPFLLAILMMFLVPQIRFSGMIQEAMLHQKQAQIVRSLINVSQAVMVFIYYINEQVLNLSIVLFYDCVFYFIGMIVSFTFYKNIFYNYESQGQDLKNTYNWKVFFTDAWYMKFPSISNLILFPGIMRIYVSILTDLNMVALFSFIQNLVRFIRNYLPSFFLRNIFRTIMIEQYEKNNVKYVSELFALLSRINEWIVIPFIIITLYYENEIIEIVSGGKFTDSIYILSTFILLVLVTSYKRIAMLSAQVFNVKKEFSHSSILFIVPALISVSLIPVGISFFLIGLLVSILFSVIYFYRINRIKRNEFTLNFDYFALKLILANYIIFGLYYSSNIFFLRNFILITCAVISIYLLYIYRSISFIELKGIFNVE